MASELGLRSVGPLVIRFLLSAHHTSAALKSRNYIAGDPTDHKLGSGTILKLGPTTFLNVVLDNIWL